MLRSILFLMFIFSSGDISIKCAQLTPIKKLADDILKNYNPSYRPVKDFGSVLDINVSLVFISANIVETEIDALLILQLYMKFDYHDELLTWSPDDNEGIKMIHMAPESVWTPKLELSYLGSSIRTFETNEGPALVDFNGTVFYKKRTSHHIKCETNYHDWPNDLLSCTFTLASPIPPNYINYNFHAPKKENSINTEINRGKYLDSMNGWTLLPVSSTEADELVLNDGTYFNHKKITTTFRFARANVTYYHLIFIPSIVFFAIIWLSFWMKNPVHKLMLACLSLIGQIQLLSWVGHVIPSNGSVEVLIVNFFRDQLFLSFLALVVIVVGIKLLNVESSVPKYLTIILNKKISNILLQEGIFKDTSYQSEALDESAELTEFDKSEKDQWQKVGLLMDRTILILLTASYVTIYIVSFPSNNIFGGRTKFNL